MSDAIKVEEERTGLSVSERIAALNQSTSPFSARPPSNRRKCGVVAADESQMASSSHGAPPPPIRQPQFHDMTADDDKPIDSTSFELQDKVTFVVIHTGWITRMHNPPKTTTFQIVDEAGEPFLVEPSDIIGVLAKGDEASTYGSSTATVHAKGPPPTPPPGVTLSEHV